jgi:hypothetical protein
MENVSRQEDFDLNGYPEFKRLIEIALAIDWSRPPSIIKEELLNQLLCLACELNLDLSKLECYPQIRSRYEKLKDQLLYKKRKLQLRREITGHYAAISFSDVDDEDMSWDAVGHWALY